MGTEERKVEKFPRFCPYCGIKLQEDAPYATDVWIDGLTPLASSSVVGAGWAPGAP